MDFIPAEKKDLQVKKQKIFTLQKKEKTFYFFADPFADGNFAPYFERL